LHPRWHTVQRSLIATFSITRPVSLLKNTDLKVRVRRGYYPIRTP
jgi:hypothetical protein